MVLARFFPRVLNMCISVNCIIAYQLIFSIEQRVFIYDQYLLTRSASQFQFAKLTVLSMTELLVGTRGLYKTNPRSLEELKRNIRDEINNIKRGELERVGNFIKRCQKWLDNEGGQF